MVESHFAYKYQNIIPMKYVVDSHILLQYGLTERNFV
jgi:hypothetical protein